MFCGLLKLKFHATRLHVRILARVSRRCYEETGPVEFQIYEVMANRIIV